MYQKLLTVCRFYTAEYMEIDFSIENDIFVLRFYTLTTLQIKIIDHDSKNCC